MLHFFLPPSPTSTSILRERNNIIPEFRVKQFHRTRLTALVNRRFCRGENSGGQVAALCTWVSMAKTILSVGKICIREMPRMHMQQDRKPVLVFLASPLVAFIADSRSSASHPSQRTFPLSMLLLRSRPFLSRREKIIFRVNEFSSISNDSNKFIVCSERSIVEVCSGWGRSADCGLRCWKKLSENLLWRLKREFRGYLKFLTCNTWGVVIFPPTETMESFFSSSDIKEILIISFECEENITSRATKVLSDKLINL